MAPGATQGGLFPPTQRGGGGRLHHLILRWDSMASVPDADGICAAEHQHYLLSRFEAESGLASKKYSTLYDSPPAVLSKPPQPFKYVSSDRLCDW